MKDVTQHAIVELSALSPRGLHLAILPQASQQSSLLLWRRTPLLRETLTLGPHSGGIPPRQLEELSRRFVRREPFTCVNWVASGGEALDITDNGVSIIFVAASRLNSNPN